MRKVLGWKTLKTRPGCLLARKLDEVKLLGSKPNVFGQYIDTISHLYDALLQLPTMTSLSLCSTNN